MNRTLFAAAIIPASFLGMAVLSAHAPFPDIEDFAFERHELPSLGQNERSIRYVNPGFESISAWISSVGAAVALFDHDGDGLHNDYCLVDPRYDSVTVGPVPTTGDRFSPFAIRWSDRTIAANSVAPMGCLPIDADQDGRMDLVVYYWGRGPSLHLASGGFEPRQLLAEPEIWNTNAATVADVNGDGQNDLLFGNYFPDGMHILGRTGAVHMQRSMSRARNAGRNRLFLGRVTADPAEPLFDDASSALYDAVPNGWTLGIGAADIDDDGYPELFISNDFGPDQLLHNRTGSGTLSFLPVTGRRGLTDSRSRVVGRDSFKGMGVDFADLDRDGNLDFYVSNIAEDYALMESHLLFKGTGDAAAFAKGYAPFKEVSGPLGLARSAWSWDARIADFNNDGVPELLQATGFVKGTIDRWPELHEIAMANDELLQFPAVWPKVKLGDDLSGDRADAFFVAGTGGRYVDVANHLDFLPATVSRGIAIGDVDGDGDPDALIARQWMPSVLLLNKTPTAADGVTFDLRQENPDGSTRPAIGAVVRLYSRDGTPMGIETVSGGEGHSGKSAPEVHFGLGKWSESAGLFAEISWRDRRGHHRQSVTVNSGRNRLVLRPAVSSTVQSQVK
ncbi:FG-GAP repeat protein [Labrenzia sp. THAF82]|uniref:CRTAC1 family protein n=1 Tax=Labrenzia sp. THAF82 TaxID=2587861 RepID=UPI001267DAC2|nr:CRTAC1 family protein [Labrenzia sp. THAF82]QFT32209.1 FG-GAP repeat protein [Labrenzia sp. THAF82]